MNEADILAFAPVSGPDKGILPDASGDSARFGPLCYLKLSGGKLAPTSRPGRFQIRLSGRPPKSKFPSDIAANEHLTGQIARQVFGINSPATFLMYLADGKPACLTRVRLASLRQGRETISLANLAENQKERPGRKTSSAPASYEETGFLLREYCAAWRIEMERYFFRVVFHYILDCGEGGLNTFGLRQSQDGDYLLAPSGHLISMGLHYPGHKGLPFLLWRGQKEEDPNRWSRADFLLLADRLGIRADRAGFYLDRFTRARPAVLDMVERSFLSKKARPVMARRVERRIHCLDT